LNTEKDTEIDLVFALSTLPWIQDLNTDQITALSTISQPRIVEADEFLFHEGDKEDYLYVLLEGCVVIEVIVPGCGYAPLYRAKPADFIGWSSVTPVIRQRTASARAVITCRLIAFDSRKLRQICDEDQGQLRGDWLM
jgi:CRP/FNR family transcriptional regulator, cyclic AMP receptor protein